MKQTYLKYVLLTLWLSLGTPTQAQILQQKTETRAVWLTTLNGMDWPTTKATSAAGRERQKEELRRILDQYQRLHLNTVLLQTRVRGTMIYPSALEGWDPCLTGTAGKDPGYDPLQFAIEECHKRGLELHCWMVSVPSGNAKVHQQLGRKTVTKTHPQLAKRVREYWYLDPGHPETAAYLASLCREIVEKYDIDGVHFDFIRYPENSYNSVDRDSWAKYGAKTGKNKADWRRDNITAMVREAYNTIKSIKPWVKVTAAPLGKYADTSRFPAGNWNGYNRVFQDAKRWMAEGIIDGIFPMLYHADDNFFPFVCDWLENNNSRPVTVGLGIYFLHPREGKWTLDMVQRQMNFCRSKGAGVAHYRSQFLTENTKGLFDWCEAEYYPYPALAEGMPWQRKQAPQAPENLRRTETDSQTTLEWSAVKDPEYDTYVTYNVYRSTTAPVNTDEPSNLVAARLMDNRVVLNGTPGNGERYHYAVTAQDRAGNESQPLQGTATPAASNLWAANGILDIPELPAGTSIVISDMTERELITAPYTPTLDVSRLAPGSYWLKSRSKDGRTSRIRIFMR